MLNKNSKKKTSLHFQSKKTFYGLTLQTYFISFYIFRHNKNLQLIASKKHNLKSLYRDYLRVYKTVLWRAAI